MRVKRLQNTHEKKQTRVSKLFDERNASIPPHSNLTNKKKYQKVTNPNTKASSTNTK